MEIVVFVLICEGGKKNRKMRELVACLEKCSPDARRVTDQSQAGYQIRGSERLDFSRGREARF